ncbi:hypothetical protein O6H91_05G071800 [Diphasiastrum complanatum]|uniref:Uncharacterized protein n=1 Tax=Diphasiastrum complanatum TaxID=34168 RepID=A0ACC2DPR4_DIPCM|nr:hypothetical protein O6H91_05G071800 [Diphasiastrum complanatum]
MDASLEAEREAMETTLAAPMQFMVLDATFRDAPTSASCTPPTVVLFGKSAHGCTISCLVNDFLPYFWFPAPVHLEGGEETSILKENLQLIMNHFNQFILARGQKNGTPSELAVAEISISYRTPLMFYRPGGPFQFLQVKVWRSTDLPTVAKEFKLFAEEDDLRSHGLLWKDRTSYEEDLKLGMRFCCDTAIAGGAWIEIRQGSILPCSQQKTRCEMEVRASWHDVIGLTPDVTHYMKLIPLDDCQQGQSRPCQRDQSRMQDNGGQVATQLQESNACIIENAYMKENSGTDLGHRNELEDVGWLTICPLRIVTLHVQCAGGGQVFGEEASGRKRLHGRTKGTGRSQIGNQGAGDVCPHAHPVHDTKEKADPEDLCCISGGGSALSTRDPVLIISNILHIPNAPQGQASKVCFSHGKHAMCASPPGTEVRIYDTERDMLMAWQEFIRNEIDPDVICMFQCKDSLRYLVDRLKTLKLGPLDISRHKGHTTEVKSVVSYGKHWVKQQARMTATSNQEVFRAIVHGRILIDMLRVVLVAYNLTTFTLAECSQVLLGKPKEVLSSASVFDLWNGKYGGFARLVLYSVREAEVAAELMGRLQTLTEMIEMARVTGLSTGDVLYKAQMIRVQSLLLRSARREGWLLGGPTLGGQLSGSPFLLHPQECKTVGFYEDPVAILDFASLYPSIFMAHNLCYTTLVHPKDVCLLPEKDMIVSPTGAYFVLPKLRHGVLPRICGALITARKQARERMMAKTVSAEEYAVLDGRQRALKLCSNALYGFTGAGASPQQALPLADSCLTMGAAACKQAVESVPRIFDKANVVYAQTDSVFIQFQGASVEEAITLGVKASELVSEAFPSPMVLKFERVLCPFLLLQVNRYAGKQYTLNISGKDEGTLFVRGLESERRDVPLFVRTGLWRVDGQDIARLAAATKSPKKDSGSALTAEEGRGPHVSLAIRMKRQDPDRQFHIGERIPYVLVANSSKLQDEMSEDPLVALIHNMQINFHVYLENKLRKPLESILEHVTEPSQLRELFTGNHTVPPPAVLSPGGVHSTQALVSSFFRAKMPCLSCRKPLEAAKSVLCESCIVAGAAQITAAFLLAQKQDEEKKYARSQAECLQYHSGGLYWPILCTNLDCPSFYLRHEGAKRLEYIESLLEKLESDCG